jgi:hypothetical protein
MPQIFHPSMNTVSRVTIFGALFIIAAALAIAFAVVRSPYITGQNEVVVQPVPFSHEHHVGDCGIDCRYCHTSVEDSAFAGIPPTKTCMNCHSQLFADSPLLASVRASFRDERPMVWTRVHDVPDFAYFNHGIHVAKGIGCSTCHGEVDKMPLMWREATLHMQWCLDCHRDPAAFVRPREDVFRMDWTPEMVSDQTRTELATRYHLQAKDDCYTCHR